MFLSLRKGLFENVSGAFLRSEKIQLSILAYLHV